MKSFARLSALSSAILAGTALATAQWNVDLDLPFGQWAGAPSSSFGGAANQPGFWNATEWAPINPTPILDLWGQDGGVTIVGYGGVSDGHGFDNSNVTGDYSKLLEDGDTIGGGGNTYTFAGLPNGLFELYTYAVRPQGGESQVSVTVAGVVKWVTGPIPPNQLVEGITHTRHLAQVVDRTLTVFVEEHSTNCDVNGFQVRPVPEAGPLLALGVGFLLSFHRSNKHN